ncbi:MAG: T9SS type A sorting domain-containing protein, partial [Saprospiraceae bacterium]|nr:T9SS type A sorting domain-containing protein [Saprospiraceae bacterium]
ALGAQDVEAINMGAFDHNGCVQFCLLDGRSFFNQYSDHSGGISITTTIVPPTSASNNDGSAEIIASGGVAPYTYSWNTGETSSILDRVDNGIYVVRIEDSRGCYYDETVEIDHLSSVLTSEDAQKVFSIFPNPSNGKVNFTFTSAVAVESDLIIRNTLGQIVYQTPNLWDQNLTLDMSEMSAGLYLVELHQADQVYTQKLILR